MEYLLIDISNTNYYVKIIIGGIFVHIFPTSDIYDIIVDEILSQRGDSMINQQWEVPLYSKSQINKAGKTIISENASTEEKNQALKVLNNWRAAHAYPLQVIASNLRRKNSNAIVVQRLKRLESIMGKLWLNPDMNLYRMQDLGGCRIIVESIEEVYDSIKRFKSSHIRHIIKNERDYIENPKTSGYRSYHVVCQYKSDKKETYNKNMLIEIQFRTKLQHIWATAVEMMGIYTKSNLKAGQGDKDILQFFTLVSSVFALNEKTPMCKNTPSDYNELISEIRNIDKKHNIIYRLEKMNVITKVTSTQIKRNKYQYYIILLNYDKSTSTLFTFTEIGTATKAYEKLEKVSNGKEDIVLVSAKSIDTLKAAYPNYFIDISKFVNIVKPILEK